MGLQISQREDPPVMELSPRPHAPARGPGLMVPEECMHWGAWGANRVPLMLQVVGISTWNVAMDSGGARVEGSKLWHTQWVGVSSAVSAVRATQVSAHSRLPRILLGSFRHRPERFISRQQHDSHPADGEVRKFPARSELGCLMEPHPAALMLLASC